MGRASSLGGLLETISLYRHLFPSIQLNFVRKIVSTQENSLEGQGTNSQPRVQPMRKNVASTLRASPCWIIIPLSQTNIQLIAKTFFALTIRISIFVNCKIHMLREQSLYCMLRASPCNALIWLNQSWNLWNQGGEREGDARRWTFRNPTNVDLSGCCKSLL